MFTYYKEQIVDKDLKTVFSFFEKPENLGDLTPDWLKFKILSPSPLTMEVGSRFAYKIKLGPIPMKWLTNISQYDPPNMFCDEQLKGPYKKWVHTHTFKEDGDKTLITDKIEYDLYGGPLKYIVNELFIKHSVRKIFDFREKTINSILGKK